MNIVKTFPMMALVAEDEEGKLYLRVFTSLTDANPMGMLLTSHKEAAGSWRALHNKECTDVDAELASGMRRYTELMCPDEPASEGVH